MPHYTPDDDKGLSADEFKSKMYGHLKKKGHLDALKTQLRYKIVEELRDAAVIKFPTQTKSSDGETTFKLVNSLVADHLRRNQYDYTLSVFLSESGSNNDKLYTPTEALHMMNIDPQSKLYQRLLEVTSSKPRKAFLQCFLAELSNMGGDDLPGAHARTVHATLTNQETLGDKLQRVDQFHSSKAQLLQQADDQSAEERILLYQRQLEQRSRDELKSQMARFREIELARVRVEEREVCRKELSNARLEMERTYQSKHEALTERERNASERLHKQQEGHEKEIYTQRQSVLGEIEMLRHREAQLRRQQDQNERELKLREANMKQLEYDVRKRELEVKQMENEFELKLQTEMNRYRMDEEAKYIKRTKQVEQDELSNREDRKIIEAEKQTLYNLRTDLHDKQIQLNELEITIERRTKLELGSVCRHTDLLNLESIQTIDYKYLKEENSILKRELDVLKTRYSDLLHEMENERNVKDRNVEQTPEVSYKPSLKQKQFERKDKEHRSIDEHRQLLESRLAREMDTNKQMLSRFEEATMQYRDMNKEIIELKQQLLETQKALQIQVSGMMPVSATRPDSRSGSDSDLSNNCEDYFDTPLVKTNLEPELMLMEDRYQGSYRAPGVSSRGSGRSRSSRLDTSLDSGDEIVLEAWKRLKQLEVESDNLQSTYRSFQARMSALNSGILTNETVRTTAAKYRVVFADSVDSRDPTSANSGERYNSTTAKSSGQIEKSALGRVSFDKSSKSTPPVSQYISPKTPLSSTPFRPSRAKDYATKPDETSPIDHKSSSTTSLGPLPSLELSTVNSGSLLDQRPPVPRDRRPKLVTVDDLEARSGSASVVVVPGSQSSTSASTSLPNQSDAAADDTNRLHDSTLKSNLGATIDETPQDAQLFVMDASVPNPAARSRVSPTFEAPSFDTPPLPTRQCPPARAPLQAPAPISLDDMWKTSRTENNIFHPIRPLEAGQSAEELRKIQEEEDREFEEQRLKREEWRKKREEQHEFMERDEQYELMELREWEEYRDREREEQRAREVEERRPMSREQERAPSETRQLETEGFGDDELKIDPVMQKYMAIVQKTKETQSTPAEQRHQTSHIADNPADIVLSDKEISLGKDDTATMSHAESDGFEW